MTALARNKIDKLTLKSGAHDRRAMDAICVMEAVAWVAGEPHSDHPECVCPVLSALARGWNDTLPSDEERNRLLRPLIPKLIGTRATPAIEQRRAWMLVDWQIRTYAPAFMDLVPRLAGDAAALRSLPEIVDATTLDAARPALRVAQQKGAAAGGAAGDAAWDAAGAAAWAAAGAAAWTAARDAAWDAAGAAAWAAARDAAWAAAGTAAWDAVWAAARDAARDAAGTAAWDALAPTVAKLQASMLDLIDRMIALSKEAA